MRDTFHDKLCGIMQTFQNPWYWSNLEGAIHNARSRESYSRRKFPGMSRKWDLMRRHGLTQADIIWMHTIQNGLCPLCGKSLGKNFVVDHSHQTGKIRGLLHRQCNSMLGFFETRLQSILDYARREGFKVPKRRVAK